MHEWTGFVLQHPIETRVYSWEAEPVDIDPPLQNRKKHLLCFCGEFLPIFWETELQAAEDSSSPRPTVEDIMYLNWVSPKLCLQQYRKCKTIYVLFPFYKLLLWKKQSSRPLIISRCNCWPQVFAAQTWTVLNGRPSVPVWVKALQTLILNEVHLLLLAVISPESDLMYAPWIWCPRIVAQLWI